MKYNKPRHISARQIMVDFETIRKGNQENVAVQVFLIEKRIFC